MSVSPQAVRNFNDRIRKRAKSKIRMRLSTGHPIWFKELKEYEYTVAISSQEFAFLFFL